MAILVTIYSLGLRSGELLHLKRVDIDAKKNLNTITNAKGKKNRIVMLSEKLNILLLEYYTKYKLKEYVFEGRKKGSTCTQYWVK